MSISKLGKEIYPHASEQGIVKEVFFRGNMLEVKISIADNEIIAYRSLEDEELVPGEKISVLIYRLYLYNEDSVRLIENEILTSRPEFSI